MRLRSIMLCFSSSKIPSVLVPPRSMPILCIMLVCLVSFEVLDNLN